MLPVGIVLTEVAVDIAAAPKDFKRFVLHRKISLSRFTLACQIHSGQSIALGSWIP